MSLDPVLVVVILVGAVGVAVMVRNFQVFRFRMRMNDLIFQGDEKAWIPLFKVWQTVSYDRMVCHMFTPLSDFFRGTILEDLAKKAAK